MQRRSSAVGGDPGLDRVAALLGIETEFHDALGVAHRTSDEALAALIASFGLPAEPHEAAAAIAAAHCTKLGLAPAIVIAAEDPEPRVALRPPRGTGLVEWRCTLEDGDERQGAAEPTPCGEGSARLTLPAGLPLGYHRLALVAGNVTAEAALIVAPAQSHLPAQLGEGSRRWGLTTQLYSLRSGRNWGMGDFGDLRHLCSAAGKAGASLVGLNPLHALFAAEPRHYSPYSPSSRRHLDPLYIDVTAVPEFAHGGCVDEAALAAARASRFVDHWAVAALKRPALEAIFRRFRVRELDAAGAPIGARGQEFCDFRRERGRVLTAFATFEALHEHYYRDGRAFSWRTWPEKMRDPNSRAVADFAKAHADRVLFFAFLQWEADRQLAAAAAAGQKKGLSLGLYRDLAVGVDPNGADAWAEPELLACGTAIGAPPDALSRAGQNWGLSPVNPLRLRQRGFAPFIEALRANMRHAGVLRIDHVMLLQRLYWVPQGLPATAGAYVKYPFRELLRLVALESRRQRCAVIGEDLGTVPAGFRAAMEAAQVLSYRVVAFERDGDGRFLQPSAYPALSAASAATHDTATIKGFWLGRDIEWRRRLGLYPDETAAAAEASGRRRDREQLLEALAGEGLMARERFGEFLLPDGTPVYGRALGKAVLAFLSRSRSRLMLVQIEDVAGESEQANLPGSSGGHPNWRRRMAQRLDEIVDGGALQRVARLIAAGREISGRNG